MSIGGQSRRRVLGFVTAIILGGIIVVGFTIAVNPPTSDIPEPSFSYLSLNDLFKYYNDTQGGAVTNFLEFHISFENIQDGRRVYLLRPTFLNKGIDFQVWVEKMDGKDDKRPSHQDVFKDLQLKQNENPKEIPELMKAIDRVWNCEEPDHVLRKFSPNFKKGFEVELLLKILKDLGIKKSFY